MYIYIYICIYIERERYVIYKYVWIIYGFMYCTRTQFLHGLYVLYKYTISPNRHMVAIFYPFGPFCEIGVSLPSLQKHPKTAPNLFQRGVEYSKYVYVYICIYIYIYIYMYIYIYIYMYLTYGLGEFLQTGNTDSTPRKSTGINTKSKQE